jgi:hypothetical protein
MGDREDIHLAIHNDTGTIAEVAGEVADEIREVGLWAKGFCCDIMGVEVLPED